MVCPQMNVQYELVPQYWNAVAASSLEISQYHRSGDIDAMTMDDLASGTSQFFLDLFVWGFRT